jgi:hypothetical protein
MHFLFGLTTDIWKMKTDDTPVFRINKRMNGMKCPRKRNSVSPSRILRNYGKILWTQSHVSQDPWRAMMHAYMMMMKDIL